MTAEDYHAVYRSAQGGRYQSSSKQDVEAKHGYKKIFVELSMVQRGKSYWSAASADMDISPS